MRFLGLFVFLTFHVSTVTPSVAEVREFVSGLPSSDQIREDYLERANDWPEVPRDVLLAFVAAREPSFFEKLRQHSTLTKEVVRIRFPYAGSLGNIARSFVVAEALSHDEIVNWYANEIYFGQDCYGVSRAAAAYFGKTVDQLSLEETAYLAALPVAPSAYHPVRQYDRAIQRRNTVLSEMQKAGFISLGEAENAIQSNLVPLNPLRKCERTE